MHLVVLLVTCIDRFLMIVNITIYLSLDAKQLCRAKRLRSAVSCLLSKTLTHQNQAFMKNLATAFAMKNNTSAFANAPAFAMRNNASAFANAPPFAMQNYSPAFAMQNNALHLTHCSHNQTIVRHLQLNYQTIARCLQPNKQTIAWRLLPSKQTIVWRLQPNYQTIARHLQLN